MDIKPDLSLATTTTAWARFNRIRGFTITVLLHLKDAYDKGNPFLTVSDLMELTGEYYQYVYSYLKRSRNYGFAEKKDSFWKITPLGIYFLHHKKEESKYIREAKQKKRRRKREVKQKQDRNKTESKQKLNRNKTFEKPKRTIQTSFMVWLKNYHRSLEDAERVVVEVLLDHYRKTGSKFIYCSPPTIYTIADRFGIRPDQVNQVLMNLKQDKIVYSMKDRLHGAVKIGLYVDFVKKLKFIQEHS